MDSVAAARLETLFAGDEQQRLQKLSKQLPIVLVKDDFLSDEECQHIQDLATPHLQRATVCGKKQGFLSAGRTGSNCWVKHTASATTGSIVRRIADLLQLPASHAESLQVIHYDKTQQYRSHYDGWLHDGSKKSLRTMRRGGQRIWTALCYLNTVPRGGSTRFTLLNKEVRP